ncbi:hypothetical protein [Synechococcus sp. CBW1108]|uniref:hypothetical protein n=1 Tax=Synechococcus sp. CBW1108 TaxID=1353147 RepID=UPI0018CE4801|nr:hypothetical protein [Synechococcus sp. CBW1108]QPN69265.1 hypothetical protein H8F27_11670 [Synechococcus sp. CBW1108]
MLSATMILIAGTAALLNQTTSTMIGSIFQGQGREARNVARSGMSYLIGQINKEQNRHLIAVLDSQIQEGQDRTAENTLWSDSQAVNYHFNPCITSLDSAGNIRKVPPRLAEINLGLRQENNGFFYISEDGAISKNRNGATRAFRIVNRDRADFKLARKNNLRLLDDEGTRGIFRLSVESAIYRNGQSNELISRTILQEDFAVIPKCCKASFGGYLDPSSNKQRGHGTTNYAITSSSNLSNNLCMLPGLSPHGFGIVVGAGGVGGFIRATGSPTIRDSNETTIDPIYCISTNPSQCTSAYNNSTNKMVRLDVTLPPPPQYPGGFNGTPPILKSGASAANQLCQYNDSTKQTICNAAGVTSSTQLPNNCKLYREAVHCIYSSIEVNSNDTLVFVSGNNTRQIRLYFPASGDVIKQKGGGSIKHCKDGCTAPVTNITDLSLFGCSLQRKDPGCGAQNIDIKGSGSGAGFYVFAPEATINQTGTAAFQGVIWAKGIDMTGTTAAPTVPASGVADVFILLGILPGADNTFSSSITGQASPPTDLFAWDMKARSTSRFRFFGNY